MLLFRLDALEALRTSEKRCLEFVHQRRPRDVPRHEIAWRRQLQPLSSHSELAHISTQPNVSGIRLHNCEEMGVHSPGLDPGA